MNRAEMRRKAREQENRTCKHFLYDYYMERGCKEEANAIWKERAKR